MVGEPFHAFGTHVDPVLPIGCGWVAHEGSFAATMPHWNATRDVCVIYAGDDPGGAGAGTPTTASNGEGREGRSRNLADRYGEQGPAFVETLNGWFCGVVLDHRSRRAFLFNDRYGLGRIYVHENAHGLFFASEAKALLRVLPQVRVLDLQGAAETVSVGCVLQDRTLFTGVSLLPGGSIWGIGPDGDVRKSRYFSPQDWEEQESLPAGDYVEALSSAVAAIMPRCFDGPQRAAMSLTGGLDGRLIMAWAKSPPGHVPCYTFGGAYRESADVRIAREIALACGQPHETLVVGDEFLSVFPQQAEKAIWTSDGTMDVTGSAEHFANALARRIAPVRVTGNYGSELMRGNIAFRPRAPRTALYEESFEERIGNAAATYDFECAGDPLSFIAFKQVPWHHYSRLAVEQSQLTLRSPYLDPRLVSLLYRAPAELRSSADVFLQLIAAGNARLARIPSDRGVRASRIAAVDAIRTRWQAFITKAEYAYDYGMPSWLVGIDRRLRPLRPERLFLGRQKFSHFRVWYRDRLAHYVRETLLDDRSLARPYVRKVELEKVVSAHVRGTGNHTLEISRLLTLELLQRMLIEARWPD